MLITPEAYRSELQPARRLFEETYVCVTWNENHHVQQQLSFDDYQNLGHVVAQFGDGRLPMFDTWLVRRYGIVRRCDVVVASLTALPALVVGTQRIATVHRRLAEAAARVLPVRIWPAPIEIPTLVEYVQWNRARGEDPALRWLLDELQLTAAAI
jgi:DNA-binding transcriptional LysR family regulator